VTALIGANARATIVAGDLAVIGYDSTNPDEFRIVFLSPATAGDVVNFTDNGWINTGSFRTGENFLTYTVPAGGHAAGTTVNWQNGQNISGTGWNSSGPSNFSFNNSGDSLIAYTGALATPTLVYGLQQGAAWDADATSASTSSEPTSANHGTLVSRVTTNAFGSNNGYYSAGMTTGTKTLLQIAIANATNWTATADPTRQADTNFKSSFTVNSSANLYWDSNGTTAGVGGTGTWDAATNNKFTNAATGNDTYFRWVNSTTGNDHTAVFAGTSGTVSVDAGGVTASGMQFDVNGYTVQNNTVTLTGSSPTIKVTNSGDNATVSSKLSGTNGLTVSGAGKLTLSGANDYSGGTVISSGTLLANNSSGSATGSGSVAVNGGTLGGTGTITGPVTVNSATVAPGASAGTLTISNSLVLNAASQLAFELKGSSQTVGSGINDLIDGVTNLTLDGTLNVTALDSFASVVAGTKWRLLNYSGTLTDDTLSIGTMPSLGANLGYAIDTSTTGQVNLLVKSVPEAPAFLLGGVVCCVAGLSFAVRRKREAAEE
jgi:autotransporter-associated beta strand protein